MAKKKQRRSRGIHPVIACVVPIALAVSAATWPSVAVVAVCGMLPTLVVLLVDDSKDKTIACTVGSLNFAGVMPFLPGLWLRSGGISPASVLTNTTALIVMYAAAAAGWVLVALLPAMIDALEEHAVARRCRQYRQYQQRLVEEWGVEVAGQRSAADAAGTRSPTALLPKRINERRAAL